MISYKIIDFALEIFSRLFIAPPDKYLLEALQNKNFKSLLLNLLNEEMEEFFKFIEGISLSDAEMEKLQVEYTKLFSLPGRSSIILYESYYKDTWTIPITANKFLTQAPSEFGFRNLLYGETAVSLKKLYLSEGVKVKEDLKELPDHLSIELNFLRYLLNRQAEELEKQNLDLAKELAEKVINFLKEHLYFLTDQIFKQFKEKRIDGFYYNAMAVLVKLLTSIYGVEVRQIVRPEAPNEV